ncbi:MAG: bifunctional indole-3-glycerol phosphate synthase/phosphoribosylanthranilate isomerase [Spirochaetia bacterium]
MTILDKIVSRRRERLKIEGAAEGVEIPVYRKVPIVRFDVGPMVICEIKRGSPSRGFIKKDADPTETSDGYVKSGVRHISVLTEPEFFFGSLTDLMLVKEKHPYAAVLRKDFLLTMEDIDVSYRAGADAVLLIAAVLDEKQLADMYRHAANYGMKSLVEVHTVEEVEKVRKLKPELVGINARDLASFTIDGFTPFQVAEAVDWECSLVFESGIKNTADIGAVFTGGFDGVLIGETMMKNPALTALAVQNAKQDPVYSFWSKVYKQRRKDRPLVKICGITNREDAEKAKTLGADMLGFVFAESKRKVSAELVRLLQDLDIIKIGVVVSGPQGVLPPDVQELVEENALDAVQFHGNEDPDCLAVKQFAWYKAQRFQKKEEADKAQVFSHFRTLVDAYVKDQAGGTGRQVSPEIVSAVQQRGPLWLAGGLGPDIIKKVIEKHKPELIDASSRLEASPGKKDHKLLEKYFEEIIHAEYV